MSPPPTPRDEALSDRLRRVRHAGHRAPAPTAWSRSSARASRARRWWSTWPRSGRSACCRAPAWCPSCATSAAPAERPRHRRGRDRSSCRRGRGRHDGAVPTAVLPPRRVPVGPPSWSRSGGPRARRRGHTRRRRRSPRRGATSTSARPPACTRGMRVHLPPPGAVDRPDRRPARRPRAGRRRPQLPARARARAGPRPAGGAGASAPAPRRAGRPLRLGGPLRRRSAALDGRRPAAQGRRLAGAGRRRRQRPGRPRGRLPGRARLVRQERQPAAARAGQLVRARLGRHRRPAADRPAEPVADGCGTCRRCLDGCPTGAIVAPGVVDARRCLAWLLQATGRSRAEHRVALGDRIYGCDDCQEVCPPNRRLDRAARHRAAGAEAGAAPGRRRPARPARRRRRRAARPPRALVHPARASPATCAATRWWCSATSPTAADRGVAAAPAPRPRRRRPAACGATRCGRPAASAATTCVARGRIAIDDDPDPLVPRRAGRARRAALSRRGACHP